MLEKVDKISENITEIYFFKVKYETGICWRDYSISCGLTKKKTVTVIPKTGEQG